MNAMFIYDGQSNKSAQLGANYWSLQPVYNYYPSKKHFYLFTITKLYDSMDFVSYKWRVPTPCIKLNGSHYLNLITEYVRNHHHCILNKAGKRPTVAKERFKRFSQIWVMNIKMVYRSKTNK